MTSADMSFLAQGGNIFDHSNPWPSWLDWLPAGLYTWNAAVAIGTLLLALATVALALSTRSLARRTQQDVAASLRSAEAAEGSLASSIRPFLVEVPPGRFMRKEPIGGIRRIDEAPRYTDVDEADVDIDVYNDVELLAEVPLRNAGQGIAFLGEPQLHFDGGDLEWTGATLSTAVPPGELTRIDFRGTWASPEAARPHANRLAEDGATVEVSIPYTDANGGHATTTHVVLRRRNADEGDAWRVDQLRLYKTGEAEPFAVLTGRSSNRQA